MRAALAIAAAIAVPIRAAADEPKPTPTPSSGPTFAPGGVPLPPDAARGTATSDAASTSTTTPDTTPPAGETPEAPPEEKTEEETEAPDVDPAYGGKPDPGVRTDPVQSRHDVVIVAYPERSRTNIMWLAGLGGGGVLLGAIGLYFHLDSRSASHDVSENQFSGRIWTADRQETYDRANRSATVAGVFYGLGGALLLATAVTYIVTEPDPETMRIHPHGASTARALVAPTPGGAIIGGGWSF